MSRTLGVLAATASRWEAAFRHFDTAVRHNTDMWAWPWGAHSQHDHARALLARGTDGDRDRARELLSAARDTYERLGMVPWVTGVVGD